MPEELSASILNLTSEEKRLYGHLFRQADSEGIGVVTGEVAVKFFDKTKLEPRILGEIWQIADKENRGLLTPSGFSLVLRLIGHCQAGREPTQELALRPGPLPKFENISAPSLSPTIQSPPPLGILQPQVSGSGPIRVPPLTPEKARQYAALFDKSGAQNGILPGEQAKQIFERAGLSIETLGRIWNLADTEQKGALQVIEFVVAMHLIASFKTGQLRVLPSSLPFGLYDAASRQIYSRSTSGAPAGSSGIQKQFSGTTQSVSSIGRSPHPQSTQLVPHVTDSSGEWAISASDKLKFDSIYNTLDKMNQGFITGNEAVPFFSESKLSEEILAQIWDLADINSAGRLTRDEFAVAMYLIRQQRGKRDGRDSLPSILPANLIPPSMRNRERPIAGPIAPAFDAPFTSLDKPAVDDLFGLDALSLNTAAPEQVSQVTGGSSSLAVSHDTNFLENSSNLSINQVSHSSIFKPFLPSSSFGQSVSRQVTGGVESSVFSTQGNLVTQVSPSEDLLGDNDPVISSKLTSETTELANLSNQVGSLSKRMHDVEGQKATIQNNLAQAATQKQEFENRLAQLRSLYEKELDEVRNLEERLRLSLKDTNNLKIEFNSLQQRLQNLQNQHQETSTAFQADQTENSNLRERIRDVNTEIDALKPALEKMKSDARQQKGLTAINKKQLSTSEAERDKLKREVEELAGSRENNDNFVVNSEIYGTSDNFSSAPSSIGAKNPFFRQNQSSSESAHSYFNIPGTEGQEPERSLSNVFGPTFESHATNFEAPSSILNENKPSSGSITSISAETKRFEFPDFQTLSASSHEIIPTPESQKNSRIPSPSQNSGKSTLGTLHHALQENSINPSSLAVASISALNKGFYSTEVILDSKADTTGDLSTASPSEMQPVRYKTDQKSSTSLTVSDTTSEVFQASDRSGSAKDDFDSAFAGFGNTVKTKELPSAGSSTGSSSLVEAKATCVFNEFPPIAELDNDESDSNGGGVGFDDDFAPISPGGLQNPAQDQKSLISDFDKNLSEPAATILPLRSNAFSSDSHDNKNSPLQSGSSTKRDVPASQTSVTITNAESLKLANNLILNVAPLTESQLHQSSSKLSEDAFDEFDDLEDAQEGDSNDDFAHISSNYRSSSTNYNSTTGNIQSPGVAEVTEVSQKKSLKSTVQQFKVSSQLTSNATTASDNHDWDAIFAGLESSETAKKASQEIQVAQTGYSAVSETENSKFTGPLPKADLPDDPSLTKLTGMGYKRSEALEALEKYDYNLERAADYLANQS